MKPAYELDFDTYQCTAKFGCGRVFAAIEINARKTNNRLNCQWCGEELDFVPKTEQVQSHDQNDGRLIRPFIVEPKL